MKLNHTKFYAISMIFLPMIFVIKWDAWVFFFFFPWNNMMPFGLIYSKNFTIEFNKADIGTNGRWIRVN